MNNRIPGTLFFLLMLTGTGLAAALDPMALTPEDFNAPSMKDGTRLTLDGMSLRVVNRSYLKGLEIEVAGQWRPHGSQLSFAGGKLLSESTYLEGTLNGPCRKYTVYDGKDVRETEGHYLDGKKHGRWKRYDKGILLQEMTYLDDQLHGIFTEFRTSGPLKGKTAYTRSYEKGKLEGETLIYSSNSGNLVQRILYHRNAVMRHIWYDETTGMVERESSFVSDTEL